MKKRRDIALALTLLGAASALCLKLMKDAGERLNREQQLLEEEDFQEEEMFAD